MLYQLSYTRMVLVPLRLLPFRHLRKSRLCRPALRFELGKWLDLEPLAFSVQASSDVYSTLA